MAPRRAAWWLAVALIVAATVPLLAVAETTLPSVSLAADYESVHKGSPTKIRWTFTRTGTTDLPLSSPLNGAYFDILDAGTTAAFGTDYKVYDSRSPSSSVTPVDVTFAKRVTFGFAAGEGTVHFDVEVQAGADIAASGEAIVVKLGAVADAYTVQGPDTVTSEITAEPYLMLALTPPDGIIREGGSTLAEYRFLVNGALSVALPVKLNLAATTATYDSDFTVSCYKTVGVDTVFMSDGCAFVYDAIAQAASFEIPSGARALELRISAIGDGNQEQDRKLEVKLAAASTAAPYAFNVDAPLLTTTIKDQPAITLTTSAETVREGSSFVVNLEASAAFVGDAFINLDLTGPGGTAIPNADYSVVDHKAYSGGPDTLLLPVWNSFLTDQGGNAAAVKFPDTATKVELTITATPDTDDAEPDRVVSFQLPTPAPNAAYTVATATAVTTTIKNRLVIAVAREPSEDTTLDEGSESAVIFTLTATGQATEKYEVHVVWTGTSSFNLIEAESDVIMLYQLGDGEPNTSGRSWRDNTLIVYMPSREVTDSPTVVRLIHKARADAVAESNTVDETFTFTLVEDKNKGLYRVEAGSEITFKNYIKNIPWITLEQSGPSQLVEGDSVTAPAMYKFTANAALADPITVQLNLAGTSAIFNGGNPSQGDFTVACHLDGSTTAAGDNCAFTYTPANGDTGPTATFVMGKANTVAELRILAPADAREDDGQQVSIRLAAGAGYNFNPYVVMTATSIADRPWIVMTRTPLDGIIREGGAPTQYLFEANAVLGSRVVLNLDLTDTSAAYGSADPDNDDFTVECWKDLDTTAANYDCKFQYTAAPAKTASFEMPADQDKVELRIFAKNDGQSEQDRTVGVKLAASNSVAYNFDVNAGPLETTIKDQPIVQPPPVVQPPAITLAASAAAIAEGGTAVYTLQSGAAFGGSINVNLDLTGTSADYSTTTTSGDYTVAYAAFAGSAPLGSATNGFTYASSTSAKVLFPSTATKVTLTISANVDSATEPDKKVSLKLSAPGTAADYTIGTTSAVEIIIADKPAISFTAVPSTAGQGSAATLALTFARSAAVVALNSVKFEISGAAHGADYTITLASGGAPLAPDAGSTATTAVFTFGFTGASGTAAFNVNTVSGPATVTIKVLSDANSAYTSATAPLTVTLTDVPVIALTRSGPEVLQEGSNTPAMYTVSANTALVAAVTVNLDVSGTATFDADYTAALVNGGGGGAALDFAGGKLTLPMGATAASVAVLAKADADAAEAQEFLSVALSPGAGYAVESGSTALRTDIANVVVESQIAVAFKDVPAAGVNANSGTTATFTVETPAALPVALSANVACADGKDDGERELTALHPGGDYAFTQAFSARNAATLCTVTATATDSARPARSGTAEARVNLAAAGVSGAGAVMTISVNNRVVVTDAPVETEVIANVTLPSSRRMRRALGAADDLWVVVAWGDGSPNFMQAIDTASGRANYIITAKYIYTKPGTYTPKASLLQGNQVVTTATANVFVQEPVSGPDGKFARLTARGAFNATAGVLKTHPDRAGKASIRARTRLSRKKGLRGRVSLRFSSSGWPSFNALAKLRNSSLVSVLDKKAIIKGPIAMNDAGTKSTGRFELYLISGGVDGFAKVPGARIVLYDGKGAVVFESNEQGKTCSAFDDIADAARPLTKGKLKLPV